MVCLCMLHGLLCSHVPNVCFVQVHTVPTKVTGKCGSVTIRLIPAPRGAGIVAARTPKKVLAMAGIEDCYTGKQEWRVPGVGCFFVIRGGWV
jgi:ribosomal protein S5